MKRLVVETQKRINPLIVDYLLDIHNSDDIDGLEGSGVMSSLH